MSMEISSWLNFFFLSTFCLSTFWLHTISSRHEFRKHSERREVCTDKEGYMDVTIEKRITTHGALLKEYRTEYSQEGYKSR